MYRILNGPYTDLELNIACVMFWVLDNINMSYIFKY